MSAARPANRPVIAVTGFMEDIGEHWGGPYPALACEIAFFRPFHERGAVTVLVPSDAASVATLVSRIDGVLLTGGADVHPARYRSWSGAYPHAVDLDRDKFEIELIHAAVARGLPVLGVCRGTQVLNVAFGGTLQLHVPGHLLLDASPEPIQHVQVIPGSRLHAIMRSDSMYVNSMHHQAVQEPGDGLRIVARADDGTPEAVEHPEAPVLGIQWHPEKLADPRNYDALVGWLLDAASGASSPFRPRPMETDMPLHPTAAKLIADAKASGRPNAHLLPVSEARRNFESDWAELPKPDIAVSQDLIVPTADGASIPARMYRSADAAAGGPVLVWFHGGGWLIGSVDSHDGLARRLAIATGMTIVNVGYRLAPEWRFPTAVNDAVDSVRWVSSQADRLDLDPSRIAVGGDSAGGNLATVAAAVLHDDASLQIRHQLLAYPVTTCDLDVGFDPEYEGIMLYRDELQWHQDNYLAEPSQSTDPRVSPLLADLTGLPPATVIMAECDPIRPQGESYVAALEQAGVPVQARQYAGMLHGFFGLDMMWDEAREAMGFAAERLKAAMADVAAR